MSNNKILRDIYLKAVESVQPQRLIRNAMKLEGRKLTVRDQTYILDKPIYLVASGKAVYGMAKEAESILGDYLQGGIVSVPVGTFEKFERVAGSKLEYVEGAKNNLPDEMALEGAKKIKEFLEKLNEDDFLLALISGGGSALLPLAVHPITLEEELHVVKELAKRGADIKELNCVRKKISVLKGGGLAEVAHPCRMVSLVLSDIIGDPLDFVSSGPTVPNTDPCEMPLAVIKKYQLDSDIPASVRSVVEQNDKRDKIPIVNGEFEHVKTYMIGNNKIAAEAAKQEAINKGFGAVVVSTIIEGDVEKISKIYAELARSIADTMTNINNKPNLQVFLQNFANELNIDQTFISDVLNLDFSKGVCLIFGGETTVILKGTGKGGRNQQLAITFSVEINKLNIQGANVSFLSCGTDGIDGPTDAAGGIAIDDYQECLKVIDPVAYLDNNDAYRFYEKYNNGENLVKIGHSGTQVMDIHVLLIQPKV